MRHTLRSLRWIPALVLAVVAAPVAWLAGCGQDAGGGTPSPAPSPSGGSASAQADLPTITLTRTGGIAGVNESIEIATDGSWTYTDYRKNRTETGEFTDDQRATLAELALDPELVSEAQQEPPGKCQDAFVYSVNVAGLAVSFEQCGDATTHPVLDQVIGLVTSATPM